MPLEHKILTRHAQYNMATGPTKTRLHKVLSGLDSIELPLKGGLLPLEAAWAILRCSDEDPLNLAGTVYWLDVVYSAQTGFFLRKS